MGRFTKALLILTLAGVVSCKSKQPKGTYSQRPLTDDVSELQMTNMRVQSFGENGKDWELNAPYGEMFTRKNLMRLKSMSVQMFRSGEKSSRISAGEGLMATNTSTTTLGVNTIELPGTSVVLNPGDMYVSQDVVVISTDNSKLTTDWAYFNRRANLITSTAPVKIVRADSIGKGVGLEATPDLSRVKIFNQTLIIPQKDE